MSRELKITVTLTLRTALFLLVGGLVIAAALELGSETMTMTATYPSPVGIYRSLITTGGTSVVGANTLLARDGGKVGIGTPTPGAKLDVNGDVNVTGNITDVGSGNISASGSITAGGMTVNGPSAFNGTAEITSGHTLQVDNGGSITITPGAHDKYVLTSDAQGHATWQPIPTSSGSGPGGGSGGQVSGGLYGTCTVEDTSGKPPCPNGCCVANTLPAVCATSNTCGCSPSSDYTLVLTGTRDVWSSSAKMTVHYSMYSCKKN